MVEVIPMTQWFVDVNKKIPGRKKSLKDLMREAVTSGIMGIKNRKLKLRRNILKSLSQWIDNLRDWCISRQIWWGHRIPVWYCKDCDEVLLLSINQINAKMRFENWTQDEDTLDTWFSSGLWTFSTLGWPDNGRQRQKNRKLSPDNWMQMGYEILFFWMARMILMSTYVLMIFRLKMFISTACCAIKMVRNFQSLWAMVLIH